MKTEYNMDACYKSVKFEIEFLHRNPKEALEEAIKRSEIDPLYNPKMIDAYKRYIKEHE